MTLCSCISQLRTLIQQYDCIEKNNEHLNGRHLKERKKVSIKKAAEEKERMEDDRGALLIFSGYRCGVYAA